MSGYVKRLKEDVEFANKFKALEDAEAKRALLRAEGYEVGDVKAFMEHLQDDVDFSEKIAHIDTMDGKIEFIMESGYFFTQEELNAEQERIAEEEFETMSGAGCGLYIEGHCGLTCEPEFWKDEPGCDGHFKCTWG